MTAFVLGAFFSLCGMVAFRYGKKNDHVRAMVIGGVLLVFPYFVSDAIWMTAIGLVLLVSLFIRR
ncbi:MAG: amino acid transport protein [Planctomycetes bacterium]|nr:amino acid transport protein [Planctomycetota bacterium]MBI3844057.1 amino acid transport protein [Planctomycetota bacterium]